MDDAAGMRVGQGVGGLAGDPGHAPEERLPAPRRIERRDLGAARHHGRSRPPYALVPRRAGVRRALGGRRVGVGAAIGPVGPGVRRRGGMSRLDHDQAGQERPGDPGHRHLHAADGGFPGGFRLASPVLEQGGHGSDGGDRSGAVRPVRWSPPREAPLAQPLQLLDDQIEPLALDELHRVKLDVAVLSDLEDRHDIRVVQTGRGAGLVAEAVQGLGVAEGAARQDLQRHATAEGDLLGLVDDPHAAAADLAEEAEVADLSRGRRGLGRLAAARVLADLLGLLEPDHRREHLADLVGQIGIAVDVLLERRPLAPAIPRGELGRQVVEPCVLVGIGIVLDRRIARGHLTVPPARRACRRAPASVASARGYTASTRRPA